MALYWYETFGIEPANSYWLEMKKQLSGENGENIIFSNEYIHIYEPPTSR